MPDISGLELLRHARAQKINWPVVVITGEGDTTN